MFGFTEEQIADFGLTFGLAGFILFMLFIIWDLALAFGMFGFIAKNIIAKLLDL